MRTGAVLASLVLGACGSVGGTPADATGGGGGSNDARTDDGTTQVAPYYYAYGWGNPAYAFTSLVDMKAKGGPAAVSIGFVLSNGGCDVTTDLHDHLDDLRAYAAAGGHARASFGGATGTYLESMCGSAGELAAALDRFVDDTGITDLDFDLEQHALSSNPALNALRGAALKQVQDAKHVQVSFTLPVAPSGLLSESVDIVQAAVTAGVEISIVNGLAMDYGDGTDLATTPMKSVEGLAQQLHGLLPALPSDAVYRHLGVTAMIGKNDDAETLSQDDARGLVAYVRQHRLGLVSFWAIQRDQVCPPSNDVALCSRLDSSTFEFDQIFEAARQP